MPILVKGIGGLSEQTVQIGSLEVGFSVWILENGLPVEYLVIHQGRPSALYDTTCNGTWLLRKPVLEQRQWNNTEDNDYGKSTIHRYLSGTFLNRFSTDFKSEIKQVKIPYGAGHATSTIYSGSGGLSVKAFLLSCLEVGATTDDYKVVADGAKLDYFLPGKTTSAKWKRIAAFNGSAAYWLTRTPHSTAENDKWSVIAEGTFGTSSATTSSGVRPALILPGTLNMPTPIVK